MSLVFYTSRFHVVIVGFIVLIATLTLLAGCGDNAAPSSTSSGAATPSMSATTPTPHLTTTLLEHLTFNGDVSGTLIAGDASHPLTHNNPIPTYVTNSDGTYTEPAPIWTQCSDFDSGVGQDYVAVIVGKVGTHGQFAITVEINEDDPAYTKPGTALEPGTTNSGGSVEVYEVAGQGRRWVQVYGPTGQPTVIILHSDRVSGTVDAWLASSDQSQKLATETLHVQGTWRCGN